MAARRSASYWARVVDLSYMAVRCPGLKDEGAWGRGRRGFYTKTQRVARAGSDVGRRTQQPGWGDNGASVVPIPKRAPCSALPRAILASDPIVYATIQPKSTALV